LAVLRQLTAGEKTVAALAQVCGTEVMNVSHHLQMMKSVGLLSAEGDGRFVWYSLVGATVTSTLLELAHASGVKVVLPHEVTACPARRARLPFGVFPRSV
jgi:ArsR family transcriptional regulator, nickel/cobalt-responsive transcriptional repressor